MRTGEIPKWMKNWKRLLAIPAVFLAIVLIFSFVYNKIVLPNTDAFQDFESHVVGSKITNIGQVNEVNTRILSPFQVSTGGNGNKSEFTVVLEGDKGTEVMRVIMEKPSSAVNWEIGRMTPK